MYIFFSIQTASFVGISCTCLIFPELLFVLIDNKVHPFSYVTVAVNRLGHAERKLKAKFKRIDKNTFVKFMSLISKVSLGK